MKIKQNEKPTFIYSETSSKIKMICVPTHYYWSVPFSVMDFVFFLTFLHLCQIYVAVLIIHLYSFATTTI